jgi:HAD superfamily hydrolase (TIGR01549 family)
VKRITAILFDIGWPIVDETVLEREIFSFLVKRLESYLAIEINAVEVERIKRKAVSCFAPSMISYFIWHYVQPDKKLYYKLREEFGRHDFFPYYRLQSGIIDVLKRLSGHFELGYAANQRREIHKFLDAHGVSPYFSSRLVSEEIGYAKPDQRLFTEVMKKMNIAPEETAMVGDRLDNDIIPAKMLGLTTIQLLIGPHRDQKPRDPREIPDYRIEDIRQISDLSFIAGVI